MSKEFKGIWIPKEILAIEDIGTTEKMILSVILALDKNGGCKANNRYFANLFQISRTRVSIIIQNLYKKSYIGYITKVKGGIQENEKRVLNFTYTTSITKVTTYNIVNNSSDNIFIERELENNFTMLAEVGKLLSTTPEIVKTLLNDFIQEQKATGGLAREFSEIRKHFVLWAKARHNRGSNGAQNGLRTHFPNGKPINRDAQGKIKNVNDQYA